MPFRSAAGVRRGEPAAAPGELNGDLAAVLARYDRDVAAMIFLAGDSGAMNAPLKLVSIDPQRAVECVESSLHSMTKAGRETRFA